MEKVPHRFLQYPVLGPAVNSQLHGEKVLKFRALFIRNVFTSFGASPDGSDGKEMYL